MGQLKSKVEKTNHSNSKTREELDLMLQKITSQLDEIEGKLLVLKDKYN